MENQIPDNVNMEDDDINKLQREIDKGKSLYL